MLIRVGVTVQSFTVSLSLLSMLHLDTEVSSPQTHTRCLLSGRAEISSGPVVLVFNSDTAQHLEGSPRMGSQFLSLVNVHDAP